MERGANPTRTGFFIDQGGGSTILKRHSSTVKNDDFVLRFPARLPACDNFTEFGMNFGAIDQPSVKSVMKVSDGGTLFNDVANDLASRHQSGVNLSFVRIIRADCRNKNSVANDLRTKQRLL